MWIYYETDGDAGWYSVRLFKHEAKAREYKEKLHDAYGHVEEITVDDAQPKNPTPMDLKCPECDGPMISRSGQYGAFWGCKKFPSCKGTRDSMGRSKAERKAEKDASEEDVQVGSPTILQNDMYRFKKD